MNWNRKYRPQKIADLHLTKVREHFLSLLHSGKFSQVFLFAGPKGTGKTSTARIIAAVLNDPANVASVTNIFFDKKTKPSPLQEPNSNNPQVTKIFSGSSFMVQELDAASNRGIDDIRSLKERVALPPQDGLISIYILDEVHMLTTEAFNALLKLLEEPPPHVVFILATTELDKIPPTVASRAQVIEFTKASPPEIERALQNILTQEAVEYDPQVVSLVAKHADGSFRDAVKLLEMIAQVGTVTMQTAEKVVSLTNTSHSEKLLAALIAKDAALVMQIFTTLRERSTDQKQFYSQLITVLHDDLLKAHGVISGDAHWPAKTSQFILKELTDPFVMTPTPIALLALELKFLEIIDRSHKKPTTQKEPSAGGSQTNNPISPATAVAATATQASNSANSRKKAAKLSESKPNTVAEGMTDKNIVSLEITPLHDIHADLSDELDIIPIPHSATTAQLSSATLEPGDGKIIFDKWVEIVAAAVKQNFGLATLLRSARPLSGETGKITISVYYSFHKEQLMQPKFKQLLDVLFSDYAGGRIELECVLTQQPEHAELQEAHHQQSDLAELAVASLM